MDMGGMSMGGMMDHAPGLNVPLDMAFARDYWYLVAGVVGALAVIRGINHLDALRR